MIKVLIIEDEIPAQRLLKETLQEISIKTEVIDCLNSIKSAVKWFKAHQHPDIVLLDIQLSDGLSFEIFKQIKIESTIIFTTAFDEYAIQAFKVNSIDYLLKPIEKDELQVAFEKYQQNNLPLIQERNSNIDFKELTSLIKSKKPEYRKRFLIQSNESFFHLAVEEIALFYSMQGVTFAITFEKREYPVNYSLENLKEQLHPDNFFKINRQFIVNIDAIKRVHSYFNGKLKLQIEPSHTEDIVVGKDKAAAFKRWMDK
ncbi:LytTR family DNA-binding domain-containing protein [Tenacibaculum maritimum]|uniref:LytR/AlgR family response regulator transcription factor n=1 Tax=Tenacibaculum maritimum TaxID=107401 RepID=UPI002307D8F6|nr:LytTR family DNA-binding domain-containing protein [Tenacibaculum maritimum]MDB0603566.1 LytTR family DNA-binding domain-containing protein [Tenacibaculum maritimum]MDB0613878.1 LytTR family DNA-binding domain-containing protein [Tenacibaculum maritimum]